MEAITELKAKVKREFCFLRELNADVIQQLTDYGIQNGWECPVIKGLTVQESLDLLICVRSQVLTSGNYSSIDTSDSPDLLADCSRTLNIQIRQHAVLQAFLEHMGCLH